MVKRFDDSLRSIGFVTFDVEADLWSSERTLLGSSSSRLRVLAHSARFGVLILAYQIVHFFVVCDLSMSMHFTACGLSRRQPRRTKSEQR
jgi:hypothetical protein